jgi:hypothetical protein
LQNSKVFKKNPDMVTRVIEGETIILPLFKSSEAINCIYTLNRSGSKVWELIDGKKTLGSIKKTLKNEFATSAKDFEKQLDAFLGDLVKVKGIK